MANKILDQLNSELAKAKLERPKLEKDKNNTDDKMLDESTGNTPRPFFFHQSHNSHGNWHKHWAHGGFEDDSENKESSTPGITPVKP